jgi:rod shape-determining protein MreD
LSDSLNLTLRLLVLGFVSWIAQLVVVSQISIVGVTADLSPLVVACVGFLCGAVTGSVYGFVIGLLLDLALVQTLGISSLLFTVIGYVAGRLRELPAGDAAIAPIVLGGVATALALVGYGAIEFTLGVNTPVSVNLLGTVVESTLLNSLIALPVYAVVRRCLIAALPEDRRRRRRPLSRLSPLSRP